MNICAIVHKSASIPTSVYLSISINQSYHLSIYLSIYLYKHAILNKNLTPCLDSVLQIDVLRQILKVGIFLAFPWYTDWPRLNVLSHFIILISILFIRSYNS